MIRPDGPEERQEQAVAKLRRYSFVLALFTALAVVLLGVIGILAELA